MSDKTTDNPSFSVNETIKAQSNYLRGTLREGLADNVTGAISADDQQIIKFHGIYQQDDRDKRLERKQQKLEPAYGFMIRVRVPGGIFEPQAWQLMDNLASEYGQGNFRLTTRQAFQLHGILKKDLKATMQGINRQLLDTIAACGDVNRNVMCSVTPQYGELYRQVYDCSCAVSAHLTPRTSAYHEIWLDGEKITTDDNSSDEVEPLYGKTYLPRKFKIGFVIPPVNDIDVYSQDIGFVAQLDDNNTLQGFNVVVGGGMGNTHGDTSTYPCIGETIGSCRADQVVAVAEKIVTLQRDYGNRSNRKRARLKYTIETCTREWFVEALEERLGFPLGEAWPVTFATSGDHFGWHYDHSGNGHLTLFVPEGRIEDKPHLAIRSGIRAIADCHQGKMMLTPNQNVTIAHIPPEQQPAIQAIVDQYDLRNQGNLTPTRQRALACVAMPTCGLAMAEAERYLPDFINKFDAMLARHALADHEVSVRITGCPNGCARPFLAEVGLVGKAAGLYNCYLGGSPEGDRLNKLYLESANEDRILESLEPIIADYAANRHPQESFGDFSIRNGYIAAVTNGRDFHVGT